jgi:caffeoyl-CoA O-methyltransferase
MMNKHLTDEKVVAYCEAYSDTEPEYLQALRRETYITQQQPHMLSGHLQGRVLSMISKLIRPQHILEIGTYTAYAALCLAEGLQPDGKLITIDIDEEKKWICEKYIAQSPFAKNIELLFGNALEIIPEIHTEFDLVFIDADKVNYKNYFDLVLPIVKQNGIILIDNVLFNGEVLDTPHSKNGKAVAEFNAFLKNDTRIEKVLLPIRDGIFMLRKR